jgi:hypothetical protein
MAHSIQQTIHTKKNLLNSKLMDFNAMNRIVIDTKIELSYNEYPIVNKGL